MRDEHGLRAAQMRVGRHQRVAGALGQTDERLDHAGDRLRDRWRAPFQIQPQIDRDLLVARAPGVQPSAGVSDQRHELTLDERVDVFVAVRAADE